MASANPPLPAPSEDPGGSRASGVDSDPRHIAQILHDLFDEWSIGQDGRGAWVARLTTSEDRPQPRVYGADAADLAHEMVDWYTDNGVALPAGRDDRLRSDLARALFDNDVGSGQTSHPAAAAPPAARSAEPAAVERAKSPDLDARNELRQQADTAAPTRDAADRVNSRLKSGRQGELTPPGDRGRQLAVQSRRRRALVRRHARRQNQNEIGK
jgi:hypothetical protein